MPGKPDGAGERESRTEMITRQMSSYFRQPFSPAHVRAGRVGEKSPSGPITEGQFGNQRQSLSHDSAVPDNDCLHRLRIVL